MREVLDTWDEPAVPTLRTLLTPTLITLLLDLLQEHYLLRLWDRDGRFCGTVCDCGARFITEAEARAGGYNDEERWRAHLNWVLQAQLDPPAADSVRST